MDQTQTETVEKSENTRINELRELKANGQLDATLEEELKELEAAESPAAEVEVTEGENAPEEAEQTEEAKTA